MIVAFLFLFFDQLAIWLVTTFLFSFLQSVLCLDLLIRKVSPLAHLRRLFIHKQLHVIVLLVLQVALQLGDLCLERAFALVGLVQLSHEEGHFLLLFLLHSDLADYTALKKVDNQLPQVLHIIKEHLIGQLVLSLRIVTVLGQIIALESTHTGVLALAATEQQLYEGLVQLDQAVVESFVVFVAVVLLHLFQVHSLDKIGNLFAWVYILVNVHNNIVVALRGNVLAHSGLSTLVVPATHVSILVLRAVYSVGHNR